MEAHRGDEQSCAVYYCLFPAGGDISELYHRHSLPELASHPPKEPSTLDRIHSTVRTLLDQDQGAFDEVFVSSRAESCLNRLETFANAVPTVVLIELHHAPGQSSSMLTTPDKANSLAFLRALAADVRGAHYQHHVMPFVLLTSAPSDVERPLDAVTATSCLSAGALDVLRSPLRGEDLNRLVGHVKETIRPPARLLGASMAQNLVDSIRSTSVTEIARHRPDLTVSAGRRQAVEDAVGQWAFPAYDFTMDELTYGSLYMLERVLSVPDLEAYRVPRSELMTFLLATRRQYKHEREVYYHNWRHAVDVTQSLFCFLLDVGLCPTPSSDPPRAKPLNALERLLTPRDGLLLLTSAIGHDVGHPGVNNAFLVACNHPLAQMYNDKSVLENFHCAAYSQLLRRHWPALGNTPRFRSHLISNILATDMQRHFEYMTNLDDLKQQIENSDLDPSGWSEKDREHARELMMALLMKAADISNIARPFEISAQWARILMNEFSRQGDLESELGIPTCLFGGPPRKEDLLAAAQSQKGFMSLFGFPLFNGMSEVMPNVSCAIRELLRNQEAWDQKIESEKRRRDLARGTVPLTFSSVTTEEVEEAKVRHHKSEPTAVPSEAFQTASSPAKRTTVVDAEVVTGSHPAQQHKQYAASGVAPSDDKRSSAPSLPLPASLSPLGGSSRRSSKDVALDQLQQLSAFAHQSLSPGSRRSSADASWHLQQSYPGSRRGSKDESLTTILVTSQGSPGRASAAGGKTDRSAGSPGKRQSLPHSQKHSLARNSVSSPKSHVTTSGTFGTSQHSPSTQPSSLATTVEPMGDEVAPPMGHRLSIPSTEDPFLVPGNWPDDLDGARRTPTSGGRSPVLSLPRRASKGDSPRILSRIASGDSDGAPRDTARKVEHSVRESRSRSRLRGLKFWKKKRDVLGSTDGTESGVS